MHEMALSESILGILQEQAAAQNFARVKRVRLEVGPLAGVEIEALRFSFEVVSRDTIADRAELEIIETEGQAWCLPCGETVAVTQRYDPCPKCGSFQLQVTGGDEMRIKDLEVD